MGELRIEKLPKHMSLYSSPIFTSGYVKLLWKPSIVFQTGCDMLVISLLPHVSMFFDDRTNEAISDDVCDDKYGVKRCYGNAR